MKITRRKLRNLILEAFEKSLVNEEEVKKVYDEYKDSYFINYPDLFGESINLKTLDTLENIIKPYANDKAFLNALGLMWEKNSEFNKMSSDERQEAPNSLKITGTIDSLLNTRAARKHNKTLSDYRSLEALYNENI